MPRFNSIKFYQNRPKIKLVFVKNRQNFRALRAPPPDPQWYPAERAELPDPRKSPSPLQISGYSPDIKRVMWY